MRRLHLHPLMRVLLLLVIAAALPMQSLGVLLVLGGGCGLVYTVQVTRALPRLWRGLVRLRWLLLAIFVLYGGFTPGQPWIAALPGISREGVLEGARRAWVLVDLLVMVYWLLAVTSTAQLINAIGQLLTPLALVGVQPQRIALRLALALDGVKAAQQQWQARAANEQMDVWARASQGLLAIEARAQQPGEPLMLPAPTWPPLWQWLLPLLALLVLHGVLR
ncbi:CbiQ family ECF transporter T component [Sinimarinibacterium sp. NLF-5-8]|uniref:CbiQ family ECF transporter T component n=1 Tax=Sinimarinibacterium sp. NLF-5-8 TaxID=2698684 RepID=UPI00137BC3A7|nr:CbiQ family ECF transporter T component [Sinimarinibacterium sp. NLF-5-8]QHS09729.1 hypothetical protein GT972_05885 [Sinimarinibacterium sp. NLF-5-8]